MYKTSRPSNKVVVGITSRSSEKDLQWLMEFIRREFWEFVSDVKYLPITNHNALDWEDGVRRCSVGILYHTKRQGRINITDVNGALYDKELLWLCDILGQSKVLVVLDDLENCCDGEKQRILEAQPSLKCRSSQLFLFPERSKSEAAKKKTDNFLKVFGYKPSTKDLQGNTNNSKGSWMPSLPSLFSGKKNNEMSSASKQDWNLAGLVSNIIQPNTTTLKISIFSRAAQSNYEWLVESLKTTNRMRPLDVHGVLITNKFSSFYSELQNCSFAILYHTQKQGRLNITDVTDSLYDEELTDLSKCLGKEYVIVVIDDLNKSDSSEKIRILRSQHSIGRLARDLFLFDEKEKKTENIEKIKQIIKEKTPKDPILDTCFPPASYGRKSDGTSKSEMRQDQDMVDHQPSSSGSSLTTRSKGNDSPRAGGGTWRDEVDSGEPENKKIALDLSTLSLYSNKAVAEVGSTIKEALAKWQNYEKILQEGQTEMKQEIQRLQRENEELQRKNRNLHKEMREHEDVLKQILETRNQIIQENQVTIEKLKKYLHDKDKTIEEKHETIQNMKRRMQDLQKKLTEKEEQQIVEMQSRQQTQLAIEKLHQDLYDKDRTIDGNHETIQNLKHEIQQLQMYRQKMEYTPKQEDAGENWKPGTTHRESQRCEDWSPISGQKDDKTTQYEHRSSNRPYQKGHMMDDGSLSHRTNSNIGAMNDENRKPTEEPTQNPDNDLIEQLTLTIQQKDEENQSLKDRIRVLKSDLEEKNKLIQEILDESESGEEKAKS